MGENYFQNASNRLEKESYLTNYKYLSGEQLPGEEDAKYLPMVEEPIDRSKYPNLFYWWWSLYPFSEASRQYWLRKEVQMEELKGMDGDISLMRARTAFDGRIDPNIHAIVDIYILVPDNEKSRAIAIANSIVTEMRVPHVEFMREFDMKENERGNPVLKLGAVVERTSYFYSELQEALIARLGSNFKVKIEGAK